MYIYPEQDIIKCSEEFNKIFSNYYCWEISLKKDDNDNTFYVCENFSSLSKKYSLGILLNTLQYFKNNDIGYYDFEKLIGDIPKNAYDISMFDEKLLDFVAENRLIHLIENDILFDFYYKTKRYKELFMFSEEKYENKIQELFSKEEIEIILNSIIHDINNAKFYEDKPKYNEVWVKYIDSSLLKNYVIENNVDSVKKYYKNIYSDDELPDAVLNEILSKNSIPFEYYEYKKNKKLYNFLKVNKNTLIKEMDLSLFDLDEFSYYICTNYRVSGTNDALIKYFIEKYGMDCVLYLRCDWATDSFINNYFNELCDLFKNNKIEYEEFGMPKYIEDSNLLNLLLNENFIVRFIKKYGNELDDFFDFKSLIKIIDENYISVEGFNEIYDYLVRNIFNKYENFAGSTSINFLICAIKRGDFKNLHYFISFDYPEIFPYYEILKEHYFEIDIDRCMLSCSRNFLKYCFNNDCKLILDTLKYDGNIEIYFQNNLKEILPKYEIDKLPKVMYKSPCVLEYVINQGYYNFIDLFDENAMIDLINEKLDKYDSIKNIDEDKELKENLDFINKIITFIDKYNSSCVYFLMITNEKLKKYLFDLKRYDLYNQFLINENDIEEFKKNPSLVELLYNMSIEELSDKIQKIYNKNNDLFNTMLPFMLTKKYDCFSESCLSKICLYPDLQLKLHTIGDNKINVLARMYEKLSSSDSIDYSGVFIKIINNINLYNDLFDNIEDIYLLDDATLENLIKIISNSENIYSISTLDDVANLDKKVDIYFENIDSKIKNNTITNAELKNALYMKIFGINSDEAKFLIDRYCFDIDGIDDSTFDDKRYFDDNNKEIFKNIFNILNSINEIYELDDLDKLKKLYFNNNIRLKIDYNYSLEAIIRSKFASLYSNSLYKINEEHKINSDICNNKEILKLINDSKYNDIHPDYYVLDGDFNLQVHALGAYRYWERPNNFKEDWLRPFISYHGICTSYIRNDQIATARISHPVYGFSHYESSAYLCSGHYDLFSDDVITKFDSGYIKPYNTLLPDEMINNTRHTHNETVIERVINGSNEIVKRTPDYVLLFVDDINNKYNFMSVNDVLEELYLTYPDKKDDIEKNYRDYDNVLYSFFKKDNSILPIEDLYKLKLAHLYEETVQASVDQNIPIVIVDRLKYAKKEHDEFNELLNKFESNLNAEINNDRVDEFHQLFLKYFNNMVGCFNYTDISLEYYEYFSTEGFIKLYKHIKEVLNNIPDLQYSFQMLDYFLAILFEENNKREEGCELGSLDEECEEIINLINDKAFAMVKIYVKNELEIMGIDTKNFDNSITDVYKLLFVASQYNINLDSADSDCLFHIWYIIRNDFEDKGFIDEQRKNNCSIIDFYNNYIINNKEINIDNNFELKTR